MEIHSFKNHLKKVYSQFDQDGILEYIFNLIGVTNKYFVEFGSNGFIYSFGNTSYLREKFNMDGLLMDGSEHPYGKNRGKKPDFERKIGFGETIKGRSRLTFIIGKGSSKKSPK